MYVPTFIYSERELIIVSLTSGTISDIDWIDILN